MTKERKINQGQGYEKLIRRVFIEIKGEYDDDNPDHIEELVEMLAYWSEEKLPGLYSPERPDWIKARAEEWRKHKAGEFNKMLDALHCECGGEYEHVDTTLPKGDDEEVLDSYQCNKCETWCIVVWHKETEEEIRREYER